MNLLAPSFRPMVTAANIDWIGPSGMEHPQKVSDLVVMPSTRLLVDAASVFGGEVVRQQFHVA